MHHRTKMSGITIEDYQKHIKIGIRALMVILTNFLFEIRGGGVTQSTSHELFWTLFVLVRVMDGQEFLNFFHPKFTLKLFTVA